MKTSNRLLLALVAPVMLWVTSASAQDCDAGNAKYHLKQGGVDISCSQSSCHGADPKSNLNHITGGGTYPSGGQQAGNIDQALDGVNDMAGLRSGLGLTSADLDNIALYIWYRAGNMQCPAGTASVSANPTAVAFGNQSVGTSSTDQTITLSNTGGASATGMVYPAAPANFSMTKTCGSTIAAGASCTITFTFSPTSTGSFTPTYTVTGSGGMSVSLSLSGTGIGASAPNVGATPTSLSFGSVNVGTTSGAQAITVSNNGSAAATNMSYPSPPAKFTKGGTCSSATLNAGASCTVTFTYSPTSATSDNATYTITGGGASINVSLSGTGVSATASLSTNTTALSFGNVAVGTTSAVKSVTITNNGTAIASSVSVSGGSSTFPVSGNTCSTTLVAGASCKFDVAFAPSASGGATGQASVTYAGGAPVTVNFSGNGTVAGSPALGATPSSLSFGTITVNTPSSAQTVTLSNTGGAPASGISFANSNAAEFVVSGNNCVGTLAAGASCSLSVAYAPSGAGADSATLTISSSGAANVAINMSGTGSAAPSASLFASPALVAFGNVNVGQTSSATSITISNTGGAAATSVSLANSNSAEFPLSANTCGSALNAGATCSLSVAYKPNSAGADSAILTFNYGVGSLSIPLNGAGVGSTAGNGQLSMPASVTLPDTNVGSISPPQTVTISNTGTAAVAVSSIASSNAAEFAVGGSTCSNVAAGGACTFSVTFAPASAGMHTASITITSNGGNSPQTILASGNGLSSGGGNPPPGVALALEYYHLLFDHYFITAIADEITKLDNGTFVGWARTGKSFNVYPALSAGLKTVCRFFSTAFDPKSSHFYTPDAAECTTVKSNPNWQFEGEVFYTVSPALDGTCPTNTKPVYRMYNNGQGAAPNHRYTTDPSVRATMLSKGWIPEGYGAIGVIMCAPQ